MKKLGDIFDKYRYVKDFNGEMNSAVNEAMTADEIATKKAVDRIIGVAATASAAVGATPIPFSDTIVLTPIQIRMIISISKAMKLKGGAKFFYTLFSSIVGVYGATLTGRYISRRLVKYIIKLIPGAGTVLVGSISATTAAVLTTSMGYAYYGVVNRKTHAGEPLTAKSIGEAFREQLKNIRIG